MGAYIFRYRKGRDKSRNTPWAVAYNKVRHNRGWDGITPKQLKELFIKNEAWKMEIPGFSIAQRRWVDLMSGEGGVVV